MQQIEMLDKIKAFEVFESGGIKTTYRGGGSYDQYNVYADGEHVANICTRDTKHVWTRNITANDRLTSPKAKQLADELRTIM